MRNSSQQFTPRWASPPGDTIADALAEKGLGPTDLGLLLGLSEISTTSLFTGSMPLTIKISEDLATHIGGTAEFWMTRDCQYRDDIARLEADAWVQSLPLKEMVNLGWIEKSRDRREQLENCLNFFGADNLQTWRCRNNVLADSARFRTSPTFSSSEGAVSAWVRRGEIECSENQRDSWDPNGFRHQLRAIRRLTWRKDPTVFIPRLIELCAEAGVAVAVVRAPSGCPASGVARFLDDSTAMILLSARHLSDDHFWFTFFHEAGHLLLHDSTITYIDDLGPQSTSPVKSGAEAEADDFASDSLVDLQELADFAQTPLSYQAIISFARRVGVAPGIVVGQLQHRHGDKVGYRQYNKVKRRYRWTGSNLEMA